MDEMQSDNKSEQIISEENLSLLSSEIKKNEEYQYGLDIVRFIAMYLVVNVHATSFNRYGDAPMNKFVVFLSGMHRYISFACCPLFIMLTGYLSKQKKLSLSYYSKLLNIIIEYFICSVVVLTFRIKYKKEDFTNHQVINGFLVFINAPYAWYVDMYIGLFLFSPFLNVLYNNLPSTSYKYTLIAVFIIVISFSYSYYRFGWRYWLSAYPLMYYFIGCFIRDYQPNLKKGYLLIFILITDILQTLIKKYSDYMYVENYQSFGCVIISTLIFLCFYNLKAKRKNLFLKIFRTITDTSLSFFLLSYIFDEIFDINIFKKKKLDTFIERLPYLLFITQINVIGSIICGLITHNLTVLLVKIFNYFLDVLKKIYKIGNINHNNSYKNTGNNNNNYDSKEIIIIK